MDSTTLSTKPLPLNKQFSKTWELIKTNWLNSLFVILFATICVIAVAIILSLIWKLLLFLNIVQFYGIVFYRFAWQILTAIIFFILAILAQFLLINAFLNPQIKLKQNLKSIKQIFWQLLLLSIIINLLFLLACLPIYISIFLFLLNSAVLGAISFILGFVLIIFLSCYLIFSPFILIEKKLSFLAAMKKSFILVGGNFKNVFWKIFILGIILLLLNGLTILITLAPIIIKSILSSLVLLFMIIFGFSYLFVIYQDLKSIKNL